MYASMHRRMDKRKTYRPKKAHKNVEAATGQLLTDICRFPLFSFLNRPPSITSSSSFVQVMMGFGAPKTWQISTAVWPSAILVTDGNVLMKLGGSAAQQNK